MINSAHLDAPKYPVILGKCTQEEIHNLGIKKGELFLSSMPWLMFKGNSLGETLGKIIVTFLSYVINAILFGIPGMHQNAVLNEKLDLGKDTLETPAKAIKEDDIPFYTGEVIIEADEEEEAEVVEKTRIPAKVEETRDIVPGSKFEYEITIDSKSLFGRDKKVTKEAYLHYRWAAGAKSPSEVFISRKAKIDPKNSPICGHANYWAFTPKSLAYDFTKFLPNVVDGRKDITVYLEDGAPGEAPLLFHRFEIEYALNGHTLPRKMS